MLDEIHTISDMLLEYANTEEKSSNPDTITNSHNDMEEIPSNKPTAKPTTTIKRKPTKDLACLSTKTIIELKTVDSQHKNILGLLDMGTI
eukprot:4619904-Ditylum_brightwellii.AAC.1